MFARRTCRSSAAKYVYVHARPHAHRVAYVARASIISTPFFHERKEEADAANPRDSHVNPRACVPVFHFAANTRNPGSVIKPNERELARPRPIPRPCILPARNGGALR